MEDSERHLGDVWKDPVRSKKRPWFVKTPSQVVHYDQRQKAKRTADMYVMKAADEREVEEVRANTANRLGLL